MSEYYTEYNDFDNITCEEFFVNVYVFPEPEEETYLNYYDGSEENVPEYVPYDDSMDGDFDTGMASAGMGTDEDYCPFDYDADF